MPQPHPRPYPGPGLMPADTPGFDPVDASRQTPGATPPTIPVAPTMPAPAMPAAVVARAVELIDQIRAAADTIEIDELEFIAWRVTELANHLCVAAGIRRSGAPEGGASRGQPQRSARADHTNRGREP